MMQTTTPLDDKTVLDILVTRKWVEGEIAKAIALNLPTFQVGYELMVNGMALMMPGVAVEQARTIMTAMISTLAASATAALEAAAAAKAAAPPAPANTQTNGAVLSLVPREGTPG